MDLNITEITETTDNKTETLMPVRKRAHSIESTPKRKQVSSCSQHL